MIHYTSETAASHRSRQLPEKRTGNYLPAADREPAVIDRLIAPTWAEIDEQRDGYDRDARRLRRWQWWFVGMFTLYTTLSGVLLLKLVAGL